MSFQMAYSELVSGLDDLRAKAQAAVESYAREQMYNLEQYAWKNAPWQDQTGLARRSLHGYVTKPSQGVTRINLAHGVDYGIYLEFGHTKVRRHRKGPKIHGKAATSVSQKYAIIEPTIRKSQEKVMRGMHGLIDRLDVRYQKKAGSMIGKYTAGKGW